MDDNPDTDAQAKQVLDFWFEEIEPKMHFIKDAEFDALITKRFLALYEDIALSGHKRFSGKADNILAAIIVLDQFSRNMFRDQAKAFVADDKALSLCKHAIDTTLDKDVAVERRAFIYMPLMHSENLEDQKLSVEMFEKLAKERGEDGGGAEYAVKHMQIIERFGRFPHRNPVLGRKSTPEEAAFFAEHGGF